MLKTVSSSDLPEGASSGGKRFTTESKCGPYEPIICSILSTLMPPLLATWRYFRPEHRPPLTLNSISTAYSAPSLIVTSVLTPLSFAMLSGVDKSSVIGALRPFETSLSATSVIWMQNMSIYHEDLLSGDASTLLDWVHDTKNCVGTHYRLASSSSSRPCSSSTQQRLLPSI